MIFCLVIIAAVFHAIWNSIVKSSVNRLAIMSVIQLSGMLFGLLSLPFFMFPKSDCWPFLIATTVVHLLYQLFLIKAYKLGDLSQVYPIARGSGPLFVSLFSYFYGEPLSLISIAGIILISIGILYLGFYKQMHNSKAILAALTTGCLIGVYTILDGLGIRYSGSAFGYIALLHIMIGLPIVCVGKIKLGSTFVIAVKTELSRGVIAGTLATVGYGMALWAAQFYTLALIASLRETSVIFAALIGAVFLNEPFGRSRTIAAFIVMLGMITIAIGK